MINHSDIALLDNHRIKNFLLLLFSELLESTSAVKAETYLQANTERFERDSDDKNKEETMQNW